MTRNRVRRPFAVEVKQRSRSASAASEQPGPSAIWGATDLVQEPVRRPAPPPRQTSAALLVEPARPEIRRVLPSLIAPPAEPEEPAPVHEAEPRLPRVRRVAPRTAAPAPQAVAAPVPVFRPELAAAPAAAVSRDPAGEARSVRARLPRTPETLRSGERWKRRLPRVCW